MPYLICNQCDSYYELEEGESPQDFDLNCECGGQFEYYANKYEYYKKISADDQRKSDAQKPVESRKSSSKGFLESLDKQSKGLIGVGVFSIILLAVIFGTGVFSSMNPSYMDIMPADIQAAKAPILVVLYAPRCPACLKLDSETMVNPEVQSKLSAYSVMRINVDSDPERASRFNSRVIPTLVLLDAKGKEIRRNVGYMNYAELLEFLKI